MNGWWMYDYWQMDPVILIAWVFWVILSITLHELGHGYAAIKCGDDTPRVTGHMTLNPVVHMGITSIVAFLLIGIAWGAMPVDPSRFRRTYHDAVVAVAGPIVNALLVILCLIAAILWVRLADGNVDATLFRNMRTFLIVGAGLNVLLAIFNMIPVPPLDGSRILATFVKPYRELISTQGGSIVGLIVLVLLVQFGAGIIFPFAFGGSRLVVEVGVLILGGKP